MREALRLKPGADAVGVYQTVEEGFMETGIEDSVHEIDYQAIDPNMTAREKESLRVRLLEFHSNYNGLRLAMGPQGLAAAVSFLEQAGGQEQFVSYARWRMARSQRPKGAEESTQ